MTVPMPFPGRSNAVRRSSSSGAPKCMKRPPLQVPTAVWVSSGIAAQASCRRAECQRSDTPLKVLARVPIARGVRLVLALILAGALLVPSTATAAELSSDPLTYLQWPLHNTVTAGADMSVRDAWASSTGEGATVAVVDTGTDVAHPDAPAI